MELLLWLWHLIMSITEFFVYKAHCCNIAHCEGKGVRLIRFTRYVYVKALNKAAIHSIVAEAIRVSDPVFIECVVKTEFEELRHLNGVIVPCSSAQYNIVLVIILTV